MFDDIIGNVKRKKADPHTQIFVGTVKDARAVIKQAMRDDPNFRYGYVANAAMLLVDRYGADPKVANNIAEDIVRIFFETE